ncbi:MAG: NAD(P)H-dependent oxidoreductase subunit E [bacterium]
MLTQIQIQKIISRIQKLENPGAGLLDALHILQENDNLIEQDEINYLARILDIHPEKIRGIISFYDCFNIRNEGRYILKVCRGVCCSLAKPPEIIEHIKKRLNIEEGETTADGLFTLRTAGCLGHCAQPPVLQVNNGKCYTNLNLEKTSKLLKKLREQAENYS